MAVTTRCRSPRRPTSTAIRLALDVETGKLVWYYQELPGDDWDADHNQERILVRTRVNPDPRHVKWISSALPRGEEREVVVTVAEGGGMFVIEQEPASSCGRGRSPTTIPTST